MIYLEMYGRCGNQMFRYAAARAIQLKYYPDEQLVINFQQIEEEHKVDKTYVNALDDFNVSNYIKYDRKNKPLKNETNLLQKVICVLYYFGLRRFKPDQMTLQHKYQLKWSKILNWAGVYWYRTGFVPIEKSNQKNKFLSGSFESARYFIEYKETIKKEFTTVHPPVEKNLHLYEIIKNNNSVCLSVRRGDFASNETKYRSVHDLNGVCKKEYFMAAIEKAKELIKNPTFVMFSDDIEWVRNNIDTGCQTFYEDGTDPVWEKLRLMSMCKNFILSNSTFSWWAQFLSNNDKKIVICPNRWFNNDFQSPLIEDDWVKIPIQGDIK